jgi:hypothetical protein
MRRLVGVFIVIAWSGLLSGAVLWGQAAPAPVPADKKQPEVVQPNRFIKDESWYAIIFNGERIGSMHTTIEEVTIPGQGVAPAQKSYVFLREVLSSKPEAFPYLKLNEEMQFNASGMGFQKLTLKMSLTDKRELGLKGSKDGNNLKFTVTVLIPSPSGQPVSQSSVQEFKENENFYCEQSLGLLLITNNWAVNQSYPLKLISPYNPNNLFAAAHLMIKEKSSQKIMGVMTEGYLCTLMILDPASSVKEMEYFIGLNGVILKQTADSLSIVKTTREESVTPEASNKIFERKGRIDPFMLRLTPVVAGGRPPEVGDVITSTDTPGIKLITVLLTEAREQLQLMKEIYEKTPEEDRDKLLVVPYQRILEINQKVSDLKDMSARNQMEEIRIEAERLFAGAEKIHTEAVYFRDEAKKDFELKNFKEIPRKLAKISELAERKELKNTEYYAKVKALVDEVAELARRAKIIEEFFATRPVINGIIYYIKAEEVKLPPIVIHFLGLDVSLPISYFKKIPASSIMVGIKVYKEGDKISEDLTVKMIQPTTIAFNYKNEEITLEYKGK